MSASATSPRTFLAIETSCDETCAAVVRGTEVLANVVATQVAMHEQFGGVVPEIASRHHLEAIDAVVERALAEADTEIDAVAVTQGPGLAGALLVGLANAKARAYAMGVPLVAVDHLLGHVASALLAEDAPELPFLCLLVSGGHTLLLDVDDELGVRLLGSTRDDAAGEAFDKGARLLGLGMPGGPAVERLAATGDAGAVQFTAAMLHHDSLDTSFAGIKTALAVAVREREAGTGAFADASDADLAAGYQVAIVETLAGCVRKALKRYGPRGSDGELRRSALAVVGGVAANSLVRARLEEECREADVQLVRVPLQYCADNAAMIGAAAPYHEVCDANALRTVDAYATSPLFRSGFLRPKHSL